MNDLKPKNLILFILLILAQQGYTQAVPEKFIPKTNAAKSPARQPLKTTPKDKAEAKAAPVVKSSATKRRVIKDEPKPRETVQPAESKLETVFSSSEDCILEIDGKWFGTLLKDEPRIIPLDFGQHKLLAQNKSSHELYNTIITILGNRQAVNIPMHELIQQSSPVPDDLKYSSVSVLPVIPKDEIRIERSNVTDPVPAYVSRNTILKTVSELSATMVMLDAGKYKKDDPKSGASKKSKDSVSVGPFLLGKYEVTQQQWQQVMGYNNSENKNCNDCPVENVSWNEIAEFLKIINENSAVRFRLPTNAEWDYAVRFDIREYIDKRGGPRYGDNVAWNENNAQRKTHSVGTRIPHRSGAYDLMGNVAEWCADWYDPEYLRSNKYLDHPAGAPSGTTKIVRGGTFANKDFIELGHRDPKEKQKTIGFRLVQY